MYGQCPLKGRRPWVLLRAWTARRWMAPRTTHACDSETAADNRPLMAHRLPKIGGACLGGDTLSARARR